jgi:hypothetical protein
MTNPSIAAVDSTLLKQTVMYGINHPLLRKEKYVALLALIHMQDGDTVISKDLSLGINYI